MPEPQFKHRAVVALRRLAACGVDCDAHSLAGLCPNA
jgi:hypothetical protein